MIKRRNISVIALVSATVLGLWFVLHSQAGSGSIPARIDDDEFWRMVVTFSEADGVFVASSGYRSDNLVSNETSLQHVIPELKDTGRLGAYVGVGPEQNFTYISALEPTIAFIIDIRRQNMLVHLLYKALIEMSADRVEFLSRLFARPMPVGIDRDSSARTLFNGFKDGACQDGLREENLRAVFNRLEAVHHFSLSPEDKASMTRVYRSFCDSGPDLRWDPDGGSWIPTYADLMAQTDRKGTNHSYLASEDSFQILKRYEASNRIVPLVGDFAGPKAMRAVGRYLQDHRAIVMTFYASNVESYLRGDGMRQFEANLSTLPLDEQSQYIRTQFHMMGYERAKPLYQTSTDTYPMLPWVNGFTTTNTR